MGVSSLLSMNGSILRYRLLPGQHRVFRFIVRVRGGEGPRRAARRCGEIRTVRMTEECDDGIPKAGENLGCSTTADLAGVFPQRDITDPMQPVLNRPMPAHHGQ